MRGTWYIRKYQQSCRGTAGNSIAPGSALTASLGDIKDPNRAGNKFVVHINWLKPAPRGPHSERTDKDTKEEKAAADEKGLGPEVSGAKGEEEEDNEEEKPMMMRNLDSDEDKGQEKNGLFSITGLLIG